MVFFHFYFVYFSAVFIGAIIGIAGQFKYWECAVAALYPLLSLECKLTVMFIFAAAQLYMLSRAYKANDKFSKTSRTRHNHIKILELDKNTLRNKYHNHNFIVILSQIGLCITLYLRLYKVKYIRFCLQKKI